jgi:dextranase
MSSRIVLFLLLSSAVCATQTSTVHLTDAYPEKARFAPVEPVHLVVEFAGKSSAETIGATVWQLGRQVGHCGPVAAEPDTTGKQQILCTLPADDFQGYWVDVQLTDAQGRVIDERQTAIDISSDWKKYPRYGYLAHYNAGEGAQPQPWIDGLNRFHINGLEFYDFQFRHDRPLAGTVAAPAAQWKDIAGREIDGSIVRRFIDEAHEHNMMAMAYNASYSAYDDVFSRKRDPLPLQWATWSTPDDPRTAVTAKRLPIRGKSWSTRYLFYMNQNDPGWQHYIFGQMRELFTVYPFDGWHVDTFGAKGGYAYNGAYVNYMAGFKPYIDNASAFLQRPIVFNAVNAMGEEDIARSKAEFVYSELWEDHETFASLLEARENIYAANPQKAVVFAAYIHRLANKEIAPPKSLFNPAAVLLADAAMFATGASHIELGDGYRMLTNEYFPADRRIRVTPQLRESLRHYYDYLTAYENYLRDDVTPSAVLVKVLEEPSDPLAAPNTIWTIARDRRNTTILHLVNLLGANDPHWRDTSMSRPEPPLLKELHVRIVGLSNARSVGWASPDVDGGKYHALELRHGHEGNATWVEVTVPELKYWSTIFIAR